MLRGSRKAPEGAILTGVWECPLGAESVDRGGNPRGSGGSGGRGKILLQHILHRLHEFSAGTGNLDSRHFNNPEMFVDGAIDFSFH